MRRFRFIPHALLLLVILAGFIAVPRGAAHADDWCWDDPVVAIGNDTVSVNLGILGAPTDVGANIHSASIVVHVPAGAPTGILAAQNNPYPEIVSFVNTDQTYRPGKPYNVEIDVTFATQKNYQAALQVGYKNPSGKGKTKQINGTTTVELSTALTLR